MTGTMATQGEGEITTRRDLAAAFRLAAMFGWDDLIFTHMSARLPGPEHHFLINPYNLMFEEITASSLVKIDLEGHAVESTSHKVNSAGFTIHSAIHMAHPEANAVMHLHTPDGQAVSAMNEGLLPLTQTAMIARHRLAAHDYEGVATDLDERARIVADLGTNKTMLLRNHGTLSTGATVAEAFLRIYFLERACEAQVRALVVGRANVCSAPQGIPEKVEDQVSGAALADIADDLVWPALIRKLDRAGASFRE